MNHLDVVYFYNFIRGIMHVQNNKGGRSIESQLSNTNTINLNMEQTANMLMTILRM